MSLNDPKGDLNSPKTKLNDPKLHKRRPKMTQNKPKLAKDLKTGQAKTSQSNSKQHKTISKET